MTVYMSIKGNFWWFKLYTATTCGHINSQVALSTATWNLCIWTFNIVSHFYSAYKNTRLSRTLLLRHVAISHSNFYLHLQPTLYKRKAKRIFTFISTAFAFCSAIDECRMVRDPRPSWMCTKMNLSKELMSKPYLSTRHGIYIYIYT